MEESLIGYIKITGQNIRTLHRHLVWDNWFDNHEKLGEYYDYIDEMEDDIVELFLASGFKDMNIYDASQKYHVLECRDYRYDEAFLLVKGYFTRILNMIVRFKEENELPTAITTKLEEYENWLYKESKYKLSRFIESKDFSDLFDKKEM